MTMTPTPITDAAEVKQLVEYENQRECGWPAFPADFDFARNMETLLRDLFNASAELRLQVKVSTRYAPLTSNPSWERHSEAMRKAEQLLKV